MRQGASKQVALGAKTLVILGTLVAVLSMTAFTLYSLQRIIRLDVLDKSGNEATIMVSPPQFSAPHALADVINAKVPTDVVVETWERELGVLTDHRYHYPDSSLLAQADSFVYRG